MPLFNLRSLEAFSKILPIPTTPSLPNAPSQSAPPVAPTNSTLNLTQNSNVSDVKFDASMSNVKFDADVAAKAQQYIDQFSKGKKLPPKVTGEDVAIASAMYNVPPSLILAQGQIENGFLTDPSGRRALSTNNPMSVGLFDSGENKFKFPTVREGVIAYAKLLNNDYLLGGQKSADDLLQNFVNKSGKRYASDRNYEKKLQGVVSKVRKIGLN